MIDIVTIKGFAIPFETIVTVDDNKRELVEHGAFSEQLRRELPVSLVFGSHDATAPSIGQTDDGTLSIFETQYGLAFSCDLMPDIANASDIAREIHSGGFNLCSVSFTDRQFEIVDGVERVTAATIAHIAIYQGYTSYGGYTACWVANRPIDALDHRRQLMAERWDAGFKEHRALDRVLSKPDPVIPETNYSPVEDDAAERRLAIMLREYQQGTPQHRASIPSGKKVSDLRVISQLFTKIYAERDRHEARLKELETRIVLLEGR